MNKIIINMFLYGLFFGSGPCIASCGPVLISYVAGAKKNILNSLIAYILFSSARISIYIILGVSIFFLGALSLGRLLGALSGYILVSGGAFIILIGILMSVGKGFESGECGFLQRKLLERDKKSLISLGIITGFLPCAPLIAIFSYAGLVSKSWLQSLLYSFAFGAGTFISPLILLTLASGWLGNWMRNKRYHQIFSAACGLVIVFLGLQLIIKGLKY